MNIYTSNVETTMISNYYTLCDKSTAIETKEQFVTYIILGTVTISNVGKVVVPKPSWPKNKIERVLS